MVVKTINAGIRRNFTRSCEIAFCFCSLWGKSQFGPVIKGGIAVHDFDLGKNAGPDSNVGGNAVSESPRVKQVVRD